MSLYFKGLEKQLAHSVSGIQISATSPHHTPQIFIKLD